MLNKRPITVWNSYFKDIATIYFIVEKILRKLWYKKFMTSSVVHCGTHLNRIILVLAPNFRAVLIWILLAASDGIRRSENTRSDRGTAGDYSLSKYNKNRITYRKAPTNYELNRIVLYNIHTISCIYIVWTVYEWDTHTLFVTHYPASAPIVGGVVTNRATIPNHAYQTCHSHWHVNLFNTQ